MKKALVERTEPAPPERDGWCTAVQTIEDILVLNIYNDRELKARHCINIKSGEYATWKDGTWKESQIGEAYDGIRTSYGVYPEMERIRISSEGRKKIQKSIGRPIPRYMRNMEGKGELEYNLIEEWEKDYSREKRERKEYNRIKRIEKQMEKIPEAPEEVKKWLVQVATGGTDYCIRDRDTGKMGCSGCGEQFDRKKLRREDGGGKVRNHDRVICPACKKAIRLKYRIQSLETKAPFFIMQEMGKDGKEGGVIRYFEARIVQNPHGTWAETDEVVRIILKKGGGYDIFYNQYPREFSKVSKRKRIGEAFDNKKNTANRRIQKGYLYRQGIEEAMEGTGYEHWIPVFAMLARDGAWMDYYNLMQAVDQRTTTLIEMLHKGRFRKLESEISGVANYCLREYWGEMRLGGDRIEEIFGIRDRQKINRIRDRNGGIRMVRWMKWSEESQTRIPDRVLDWMLENSLEPGEVKGMASRLSPEQIMNYVMRQKKESYPKWSIKTVISQYEDYLSMCEKLHKDTTDEMVYRPRELKRRHDELVEEIRERETEIEAEEYSRKFQEAEQVLREVKKKLEYRGEKYFIRVPERIVEIVKEGRELHHCVGSTDRYFDRIKQQETYLCFLRKTEKPEIPYYTIEVEPGGTIRQHRGMYDEEPEIEEIRPFLREWQKEIRRRMTEKDRGLEQESARKREENLKKLREENNTRVLQGLMEDFMEIEEAN